MKPAAGIKTETFDIKGILPKDELRGFFDCKLDFEEYDLRHIDMIRSMRPHIFFGLASIMWNRIIEFGLCPVDPTALDDDIKKKNPDMFRNMSAVLGTHAIKDIYYAKSDPEAACHAKKSAVELFVARVYPNNLYIADVFLPCPETAVNGKEFGSAIRDHRSLYSKLVNNAVDCGRSLGCNYLMITANSSHQVDIFSRCGFLLEDHLSERRSLDLGLGIPMVMQV